MPIHMQGTLLNPVEIWNPPKSGGDLQKSRVKQHSGPGPGPSGEPKSSRRKNAFTNMFRKMFFIKYDDFELLNVILGRFLEKLMPLPWK